MTQQYATTLAPTQGGTLSPVYSSDLERTIGVLQQLQKLVAVPGTASLADVVQIMHNIQRDFGEDSQLEHVIQALVGQHLAPQLTARRLARQQHRVEPMEVLS